MISNRSNLVFNSVEVQDCVEHLSQIFTCVTSLELFESKKLRFQLPIIVNIMSCYSDIGPHDRRGPPIKCERNLAWGLLETL